LPGLAPRRAWIERAPAALELRLGLLLDSVPGVVEILLRLKFPNKVASAVDVLVREAVPAGALEWTEGDVRRWAARAGEEAMEGLLDGAQAKGLPQADVWARRVRALLAQRPPLKTTALALDGQEIMATLGVGPSPAVGQASRYLLDQVLEHPEWNTPERLRELLGSFRASG
jgi:tRNA nucleotidyltransferase (CCA-adding enzyme)